MSDDFAERDPPNVIQVNRCAHIDGYRVIYRTKFKALRVSILLIGEVSFETMLLVDTMLFIRCARQSIVVSDLLDGEVEGICVKGYLFFYNLTRLNHLEASLQR